MMRGSSDSGHARDSLPSVDPATWTDRPWWRVIYVGVFLLILVLFVAGHVIAAAVVAPVVVALVAIPAVARAGRKRR